MKTYEIEIESRTSRIYFIDAESQDEAETRVFQELDADWEISKAWKQNAEITYIEEHEKESEEDSMELINPEDQAVQGKGWYS
tara:strand:- start:75 stop:323 length:249 start_codon:yes stop_codon:yes gene_type:complete